MGLLDRAARQMLRSGEMFGQRPVGGLLSRAARPDAGGGGAGRGGLTQDQIERYMRGYCGDLACRIHARTGWPIEAIEVQGTKEHFMVRMPDGRLLDARGALSPEQAVQGDWFSRGQPRIVSASPEEVRAHHLREQGRDVAEGAEQYDSVIDQLLGPARPDGGAL